MQQEFTRRTSSGWVCYPESRILSLELENHLGYRPRADVLLEREDGSKRLWIEFEISRADPVANHAKFATAHLFQPQSANDIFISMVSSHVDLGRRNLAANTILLMRCVGMTAFQTVLLPQFSATLITQFRTWLWVKSALASATPLRDTELADCCGISNPKRLYYLRQEVSEISIQFLTRTVAELFSLENHLKQGALPEVILPILVKIAVRQ